MKRERPYHSSNDTRYQGQPGRGRNMRPEGVQIRRIRRTSVTSKKRTYSKPPPEPKKSFPVPHIPSSIGKVPQGNRPHPDDQETNLKRQIEAGAKNDYCQAFVDSGSRTQNFIVDEGRKNLMQNFPKLRELILLKNELIEQYHTPPYYLNVDLKNFDLKQLQSKFDVILVDPPWEEYMRRCPGAIVEENLQPWTFQELCNLNVQDVADEPSFLFLWVGSCEGLNQGRRLLKKWGFRQCEVICWLKTNKEKDENGQNKQYGSHVQEYGILQHTCEHCLMGIRGTVRRSTDGHIIHANVDNDIIIAENPPYGSTQKPEDIYDLIQRFCMGRKRLELFGTSRNIRPGWVTVGQDLPEGGTYSPSAYHSHFQNPNSRYVPTTDRVEQLRPKSPPRSSRRK